MDIHRQSLQRFWESVFVPIRELSMENRNRMSMWLSGYKDYFGKTLARF